MEIGLGFWLRWEKEYKFALVNSKVLRMKQLIFIGTMAISMFGIFSFTENTKTSAASYYHDKFNGRKTASGEIFNNKEFTAANKTLPFGTRVKITNTLTDKSVIVRINDRGPFTHRRAFDLSKAAFNEIGNVKSGTIPIKYKILED